MLWNCNPRIFKLDSVFPCHCVTYLSVSLSLWLLFLCRRALSWDRKSWSWSRRWRISSCQLSTSSWDSTADTSASSKLAIMYVNKIQNQITDKIIIKRPKKHHKNPNETDDLAPPLIFAKLYINHNQGPLFLLVKNFDKSSPTPLSIYFWCHW